MAPPVLWSIALCFASCPRSGGHRKVKKEQEPCLVQGFLFVRMHEPLIAPHPKKCPGFRGSAGLGGYQA